MKIGELIEGLELVERKIRIFEIATYI